MRVFTAAVLSVVCSSVVAFADTDPSPKEQVDKVITDHWTEIRGCYTDRVKTKTKLEGKLVVVLTIEDKGNVSDVKVTQSLDPEVDACVSKAIKGLTFPAPGQQVKLKYPFDFKK
ncbi:MAG TPA: AgmX/PglI C-terminal domain-containing protein [Kofleriaceae bacterium]